MFILIGFIVTTLVGIFWGGYVASTLWGWFMVPLGVAAITYWHAVGLGALLSVFLGGRGIPIHKGESEDEAMLKELVFSVIIPALGLAMGWLAKFNL